MPKQNENVLLDDELLEESFNDALESLQKSLKGGSLSKAKDEDEYDEAEDEEAPESEEEEDEEEEEVEKSLSDYLAEEPEAAAAMDVEPFLRQLVKGVEGAIAEQDKRIRRIESMAKSQGKMLEVTAQLQKSSREMLKAIGEEPVPGKGLKRLEKARFEGQDGIEEYDAGDVLQKSRDWVLTKKIDLTEAGLIEGRVNKGLLGKSGDRLDKKVAALMKEGK